MATTNEILEKLRHASVQHGAAIKHILEDVAAMARDLTTLMEAKKETDAQLEQLGADIAALAGADPQAGEAPEHYDDDEEDAEYEEAGG